ncbi:MAG TPA: hypothetical protein VES01_04975 [Dermatophilaceae bacterium]|nr:hypothetical protein [Dermatophilaceae bacterium]
MGLRSRFINVEGSLPLTITPHLAAPVDRVWELYADPHQLERV